MQFVPIRAHSFLLRNVWMKLRSSVIIRGCGKVKIIEHTKKNKIIRSVQYQQVMQNLTWRNFCKNNNKVITTYYVMSKNNNCIWEIDTYSASMIGEQGLLNTGEFVDSPSLVFWDMCTFSTHFVTFFILKEINIEMFINSIFK